MAVNVSGTVQVGGISVSAQVETGGVNATATVHRSNTDVSASVEHNSTNVSATAHTRSANVGANVNPHVSVMSDHSRLQNLDFEHAGHTGFQSTLTEENAGEGIDITDGVISCTVNGAEWGNITGTITVQTDLVNFVKSAHKSYRSGDTLYEGVAPYGSLSTDAVWTITTITTDSSGTVTSTTIQTNQTWIYN